MLAMNGCDITGIDLVKDTISYAKAKTLERHVEVNFVAGNVLKMYRLFMEGEFDIVIGPGLFHVMTDEERPVFARQVHRVLKTNISCYISSIMYGFILYETDSLFNSLTAGSDETIGFSIPDFWKTPLFICFCEFVSAMFY